VRTVSGELKIGVFVCECGGNIGDVVDVQRVVEAVERLEDVVLARNERYLCSKPSIDRIREAVKRRGINRVVLACCTPKMHRETFRGNLEEEGLNPQFLEMVNIREQCSWVHKDDPKGATQKALDLIRGAVERAKRSVALEAGKMEVVPAVLVIGGGVAGITASLRLAEYGLKVYLAEREPSIGGHMIKYPKVFPTLDCSQCILTPKMASVSQSKNIELLTYTEVKDITGVPGDFRVKAFLKPRGVNVEECIGCGTCNRICPVETTDDYNENLGRRKAVYISFPQAVPSAYTVDLEACTRCGKCAAACPKKAINLDDKGREIDLNVGAIVLATGFELYDMAQLPQYGYGKYPSVVTSLQLERILDVNGPTGSELIVPETKRRIESVAFVLCAGSRDTENGVPYCSRVCCLYALKQAELLRDRGVDVWVHYLDLRAAGRRYEEFYRTAQEKGVNFVKGKVTEIVPEGERALVRGEDMMLNIMIENPVDLVVLCPPTVVGEDTLKLAETLKVPVDEDKFILERHPKLDPVATKRDGVFGCGMVLGPKDIQSATAEAEGAAMKTVNFLSEARVIEPNRAFLSEGTLCDSCGRCVEICPEKAIVLSNGRASINEIVCNGCGACIPECPREALDQHGLSEEQLTAQIRGILEGSEAEIKILAFAEESIVYTAADLAGLARLSYPSSIRIVPLPSMSRLKMRHILEAFAHGADGVMVLEAPEKEGPYGRAHVISEQRVEGYKYDLEDHGVDSLRLWYSRVFVPDWRKLEKVFKTYDIMIRDEGPLEPETRKKLLEELGRG
jgi:heterodisulfide reductase subunit A